MSDDCADCYTLWFRLQLIPPAPIKMCLLRHLIMMVISNSQLCKFHFPKVARVSIFVTLWTCWCIFCFLRHWKYFDTGGNMKYWFTLCSISLLWWWLILRSQQSRDSIYDKLSLLQIDYNEMILRMFMGNFPIFFSSRADLS